MISYTLTVGSNPITISLDVDNPNERTPILYQGDRKSVEEIRDWLKFEPGAFGHLIGEITTPVDLHYVMTSSPEAAQYTPVLTIGADLVTSYLTNIPPDATS